MLPQYTPKLTSRFWSKVHKTDGCWLWTAGTDEKGYGQFWRDTRMHRAHRIAYELTYGTIATGMLVCHACDNPRCVRPDHLFLGTIADNNADRDAKGRVATGERSSARLHPDRCIVYGTVNGQSKLTEAQVVDIRQRYAAGNISMLALGRMFGVSDCAISNIVHRKTWSHVS